MTVFSEPTADEEPDVVPAIWLASPIAIELALPMLFDAPTAVDAIAETTLPPPIAVASAALTLLWSPEASAPAALTLLAIPSAVESLVEAGLLLRWAMVLL